ncbi:MAG: hypothetical protein FD163_1446 [Hyphomonadaceae bacterium]|nr:MAG: hypothetical protein FD163_1446 [Hyphomonadaceae bacterium]
MKQKKILFAELLYCATAAYLFSPLVSFAQNAPNPAPFFADIFTDHAVLQRGKPIKVWGHGTPNSDVSVSLGEITASFQVGETGEWQGELPAQAKGGPFSLSVTSGTGSQRLDDILIGDVFLCSGQSNMEFPLRLATGSWSELDIPAQNNLRFITIARNPAPTPQTMLLNQPKWQVVNPQTRGEASAVCYHMAKSISQSQNVAVGMVHSSWGGSQIQAWMNETTLRNFPNYNEGLDALKTYTVNPEQAATNQKTNVERGWDSIAPNLRNNWSLREIDDSSWKPISVNAIWENSNDEVMADFDGAVWYRTHVNLTREDAAIANRLGAKLNLGTIDDSDITYINGQKIGSTDGWNTPRQYDVPRNIFRAGDNVISVFVLDTGGGGGLYGTAQRNIAIEGGRTIALSENWSFKVLTPIASFPNSRIVPWGGANGLTTLHNGMIAPIAPFSLAGIAWYQGETNASNAREYRELLPAMINQWRSDFGDPNLPFFMVQLSSFGRANTQAGRSNWGELRESQRQVALSMPNVAMVVSLDVGDKIDIHPTQKAVLGVRLANAARRVIYHENAPISPQPTRAFIQDTDVVIEFSEALSGLKTYGSNYANGFEICNATYSCQFVLGRANGSQIILVGAASEHVSIVRYGWADTTYGNTFNSADLPLGTFEIGVTRN